VGISLFPAYTYAIIGLSIIYNFSPSKKALITSSVFSSLSDNPIQRMSKYASQYSQQAAY
jgi:hypothetical protein